MRIGTKRLRTVALAGLAALALATSACASDTTTTPAPSSSGSAGTIKAGLKVTFLPKQVNNPYFNTSDNGGKAAVAEFKGVYSETGPSNASASAQVSYINTLSQQHTDVIAISADDKDAVCPALNEARQ